MISCIAAMAPTASAHSAAIALSATRSISGKAAPGSPSAVAGLDAHAGQRHLGGAQAVDASDSRASTRRRALASTRNSADAVAVALAAGKRAPRR